MDEISLAEVSNDFSNRRLTQLVEELEQAYPDQHPRHRIDDFQQGFLAGALEVIRRLKGEIQ